MLRRQPRSTRTNTLFPYTTLFRSCSICAAENLDHVVTKITVLVPWSLRLFGRNKCPHVHVYGAIVDFQNDVGIVDTGLLRNVFSRNVVANQPVLEDFVDVDLCPQRRSVFGTPGDHGWRWEVGDTQKAGSEQLVQ